MIRSGKEVTDDKYAIFDLQQNEQDKKADWHASGCTVPRQSIQRPMILADPKVLI